MGGGCGGWGGTECFPARWRQVKQDAAAVGVDLLAPGPAPTDHLTPGGGGGIKDSVMFGATVVLMTCAPPACHFLSPPRDGLAQGTGLRVKSSRGSLLSWTNMAAQLDLPDIKAAH